MPVQMIVTLRDGIDLQFADDFVETLERTYGEGTLHGATVCLFPRELVDLKESFANDEGTCVVSEVDGVRYGIVVGKDEDGNDNLRFETDPSPRGLNTVRYEWTGNLDKSLGRDKETK